MNARGPGRSHGLLSVDAYELDLDQALSELRRGPRPASGELQPTAPGATVNADLLDAEPGCPELDEAHCLLEALGAGDRRQTVPDRLRDFIERAAGERAAATLRPDFGKALARYHLEKSGHPDGCPCNPCRQARLMR